jgi:predicted GIY-YIG superfamily endonuclease
MPLIYCLTFSNGKQYIGMTSDTLRRRINNHRMYMRKGCDFAVYRAWRKYGDPEVKTLAVVEPHMLRETERKAIAVFGTMVPNGYNLMLGGEGADIASEETRAKQSIARKGRPLPEKHRENLAAATRARSYESLASNLGRTQDAKWVEKRAAANSKLACRKSQKIDPGRGRMTGEGRSRNR